jgi:hypothetical protein
MFPELDLFGLDVRLANDAAITAIRVMNTLPCKTEWELRPTIGAVISPSSCRKASI